MSQALQDLTRTLVATPIHSLAWHLLTNMLVLILAGLNMAVFHLATARGIARWDTARAATAAARFAGASSLLCWIGILLAGRWIGHLL
jgi:hypothetical protein